MKTNKIYVPKSLSENLYEFISSCNKKDSQDNEQQQANSGAKVTSSENGIATRNNVGALVINFLSDLNNELDSSDENIKVLKVATKEASIANRFFVKCISNSKNFFIRDGKYQISLQSVIKKINDVGSKFNVQFKLASLEDGASIKASSIPKSIRNNAVASIKASSIPNSIRNNAVASTFEKGAYDIEFNKVSAWYKEIVRSTNASMFVFCLANSYIFDGKTYKLSRTGENLKLYETRCININSFINKDKFFHIVFEVIPQITNSEVNININNTKKVNQNNDVSKCRATQSSNEISFPSDALLELDYIRARLKPLRESTLTSPTDGHVDLFWPDDVIPDSNIYKEIKLDKECYAKDPWELVDLDAHVAIDFGTSSTVVAIKKGNGQINLVRLGNFDNRISQEQYENPTVLEFVDYERFLKAWRTQPNKPLTSWSDLLGSHDAKAQIKEHASSGLTSIKTWARKKSSDKALHLLDEHNKELELYPLPVIEEEKSQNVIGDYQNRPFDPIEVYGYYLGLMLNTQALRGGSIYLDYSLSYPVKFDKETKERIRQGLKRGILRSLPASLLYSPKWKELEDKGLGFRIEYQASEPVALAAAALKSLNIEPSDEPGTPFCVFDFGGGTSDFAAGFYRMTSDEEYDATGKSEEIKILNTSGDADLGGEHIIDLLVYEVLKIKENAAKLQAKDYSFALPSGFTQFNGSECLWGYGQESFANTMNLREVLRPVWEGKTEEFADNMTSGTIEVKLIDSKNKSSLVTLSVDFDSLIESIKTRIFKGLENFFLFWKQSFETYASNIEKIHLIFAGNSCKSLYFREMVEKAKNKVKEFSSGTADDKSDCILEHYEYIDSSRATESNSANDSEDDIFKPNLKNSVAIGLLTLLTDPQISFKMENCQELVGGSETDEIESPFDYFVGVFDRKRKLKPILQRNCSYNLWTDFGVIRPGMIPNRDTNFTFGWSSEAGAAESIIDQSNCMQKLVRISPNYVGYHFMVKATSSACIVYGFSKSGTETEEVIETTELHLD